MMERVALSAGRCGSECVEYSKNIGVSIEYPSLYPELSGHEHFKIMANWKHLDSKRIEEMEQFSDLKDGLYRARISKRNS